MAHTLPQSSLLMIWSIGQSPDKLARQDKDFPCPLGASTAPPTWQKKAKPRPAHLSSVLARRRALAYSTWNGHLPTVLVFLLPPFAKALPLPRRPGRRPSQLRRGERDRLGEEVACLSCHVLYDAAAIDRDGTPLSVPGHGRGDNFGLLTWVAPTNKRSTARRVRGEGRCACACAVLVRLMCLASNLNLTQLIAPSRLVTARETCVLSSGPCLPGAEPHHPPLAADQCARGRPSKAALMSLRDS